MLYKKVANMLTKQRPQGEAFFSRILPVLCIVPEFATTDQGYVRCFWILGIKRRPESSDVQALTSTAEVASGPVAAQDSLPTRSLCRCAAAQKHALSGVSKGTDTCVAPTSPCRTKLDTHVSLENSQSRRRNLLPTTSVVEVPRSTESLRMQT